MKTTSTILSLLFLGLPACSGLSSELSRRGIFEKAQQGLVVGLLSESFGRLPAFAQDAKQLIVPKDKAVLVLGANGQTGSECVSAVLQSGRPCVATSRSGNYADADALPSTEKLMTAVADVKSLESLQTVITSNLGAVIFAASASAKGGDAFAVDRDGLVNAAQACIAANVPRLVVVSSGTVTRPDSAVYKLLNTVGKGIMEAKIQGEDQMRELYAAPNVISNGLGYTVVRPGGLTTGESLGAAALELNQGDSKSGRIARADVAAICVNALDSASTWDTTFECYERLTAKPIESVGLSNILRLKGESTFLSGKERNGDSWATLFDGLEIDQGRVNA